MKNKKEREKINTSRKKRNVDNGSPLDGRTTRIIVIVVEGKCTEKQYLEAPCFDSTRVIIEVLETRNGDSHVSHLMDRLRAYVEEHKLEKGVIEGQRDQLWVVADKDHIRTEDIQRICDEPIEGFGVPDTAISNPCFELWLYLHLGNWKKQGVCDDLKKALSKKLGSYDSSNIKVDRFVNSIKNINDAINRAQKITKGRGHVPNRPGTNVYKLVQELQKVTD